MKYIKHIFENLDVDTTKYDVNFINTTNFNNFKYAKEKYDTIANIYEFIKKQIILDLGDLKINGIQFSVTSGGGYVFGIRADHDKSDHDEYVSDYIKNMDDDKDIYEYKLGFQFDFINESSPSNFDYMDKIDYDVKHYNDIKSFIMKINDKYNEITYGGIWMNFSYDMKDYVNMISKNYKSINR